MFLHLIFILVSYILISALMVIVYKKYNKQINKPNKSSKIEPTVSQRKL